MSDILGIGTDLVEISRMETMKDRDAFIRRYYTEKEAAYIHGRNKSAAQTMAGMFAAKEAAAKAMGTGVVFSLQDIEILHHENGMPYYRFYGKAAELAKGGKAHLSVSHDGGMAIAFCVIEIKEE